MIVKALKKGQTLQTEDGREVLGPDASKGERTRVRILDEAAALASESGIGAVTIGPLAERLGMSKSGLFAHFKSKDALQVEIVQRAAIQFEATCIRPLLDEPEKPKRLERFLRNWLDWIDHPPLGPERGSCPILGAYFEFDNAPGPVRDAAAGHFAILLDLLRRLARAASPEADARAIAAAVCGLAMSYRINAKLLRDPNARADTLRAFHALLTNPPQKGA
jgi:AcrR family transcriptional regulator